MCMCTCIWSMRSSTQRRLREARRPRVCGPSGQRWSAACSYEGLMSARDVKVSVVIPTYNGADVIGEAVESALDQEFDDFEVIVVDDGSTDRTPDVLAGFRDARFRVIRQENRGIAGAW